MSTLDIKKQIKRYIIFTIFCLIFGIVYELFSHNVYSIFMYLAFLIPLTGVLFNILFLFVKIDYLSNKFLNYGLITLTIGSLVNGALDIYGTTNKLVSLYLIFGLLFITISVIIKIIKS